MFSNEIYFAGMIKKNYYKSILILTVYLKQQYDIFPNLTPTERTEFHDLVQLIALANDHRVFYKDRQKLFDLIENNEFNRNDIEHKKLMLELISVIADYTYEVKPFGAAEKHAKLYFGNKNYDFVNNLNLIKKFEFVEELYIEGDLEKGFGLVPLAMKDRKKANYMGREKISILLVVYLPLAGLLRTIMPNTAIIEVLARYVNNLFN